MHPALMGALAGFALGFFIYMVDYMQLRGRVKEREEKTKRRQEFSGDERKHLSSVRNFCLLMPIIGAFLFWGGAKFF